MSLLAPCRDMNSCLEETTAGPNSQQQHLPLTDPDRILLDRYAGGDTSALGELINRHYKATYRLAYRMLGNDADAEDLVQDVLLKAITHLNTFRRRSSLRTWLYRIGLNLNLNAIRNRRHWQHEDLEGLQLPGSEDPFKTTAIQEAKERLQAAIQVLPPRQFETVMLRVYKDQTFKEIGATLGCTAGTAKANYHHALSRLRKMFKVHDASSNTDM